MLNPPNAQLLLAHLRERKAAMAKAQKEEEQQAALTGQQPPGRSAGRRPAPRH